MREVITARKLRGRVRKLNPNLEFHIGDIKINGSIRGCSGFIVEPISGKIVYVNTESSAYGPLSPKFLYRKAKDLSDYRGGRNMWADSSDVATPIIEFFDLDFSKIL